MLLSDCSRKFPNLNRTIGDSTVHTIKKVAAVYGGIAASMAAINCAVSWRDKRLSKEQLITESLVFSLAWPMVVVGAFFE